MLREAGIQAELGPTSIHLVEIHEAVLTPDHVGFIMEYAAGGALTGYIAEAWVKAAPGGLVLPVPTARFLFIQFCRAVSHCHALGVAHRDLKLDNTLLDGSSPVRGNGDERERERREERRGERATAHTPPIHPH